MANTILTPTAVTREALRILHQKLNFVGSIHRDYDDSFAQSGAKIGDSLKVRLPNQYTVRSGATLSTQNTAESSVTLQIATQKGVDINFSSNELTLSMDDFSKRVLRPAMSVLAAAVEADALGTMIKQVPQLIDGDAAAFAFTHVAQAAQKLDENLAPADENRTLLLCPTHKTKYGVDTKGLFNPQAPLGSQYSGGMIADVWGFNPSQSTHLGSFTTGTAAKTTGYTVNGATQAGATITIQTGTTTFLVGDVVTFAGCNAVHAETKVSLGYLKQFVVTANSGASATSLAISPAIVTSGAYQNVSAYPDNTGAVVKVGAGVSETLVQSLAYHKDFAAFATADLVMPKGVDFSAREVLDGISMRIVRQYDIVNDQFPCRLDILYGYKVLRPELAARIHADG